MLADMVRPTRAVTRSRSCSAALREKVSARIRSGWVPSSIRRDDRLDQRRGLAGAGPGQDQQRPSVVVDDALLLLVEDRRLTGE